MLTSIPADRPPNNPNHPSVGGDQADAPAHIIAFTGRLDHINREADIGVACWDTIDAPLNGRRKWAAARWSPGNVRRRETGVG